MVIEEVSHRDILLRDIMHQSKIAIPPFTGVPRPQLVARIEDGVRHRLTVVSAPPGWGKSTVVAEWAHLSDMPVAWVSLDEADNDPHRFFQAVAAALDQIYPTRMDDLLTMLRSPVRFSEDAIDHAILTQVEAIPGPTVIVLEDFHVLTEVELLRSIGRVIDLMPSWVHLVVTTRGEMRIPVARLRAAGEVTLIRADDLAFSAAETQELLSTRVGSISDSMVVAQLVGRTEGWIAGLQLAILAMQTDRQALTRLRGTQRDIADYFREEVLDRLSPECYHFLVETAPLERFTESLATEVTGVGNVRLLLQEASADVFLTPLDGERRWFRYHSLFRDVLLEEFAALPWERQRSVHSLASVWFEHHALIAEAVDHGLAAMDTNRVSDLIETHADRLLYSCGQSNQLVSWIDQLPAECLIQRPGLLRVQIWALTTLGRLDQAERLLARAWQEVPSGSEWEGLLTAVQARLAAYRGDHHATISLGERAMVLLDPIDQAISIGDVVLSMGFAWRSLGNLDRAIAAFAEAASLGRSHGNDQAARWGSRYGALTLITQGKLREAEAIIDEDLDRLAKVSETGGTYAALMVTKAEVLIEQGENAHARIKLEEVLPIILRTGDAKTLMNAYVALSSLYQIEGNPDAAREKLRRAEDLFPSQVRGARTARLDLRQGNLGAARRWADSSGFTVSDAADPSRGEDDQFIYARIMAESNPVGVGLLQRLATDAEEGGRFGRLLEILVALAAVQSRGNDLNAARLSLNRAIELAQAEGFVQVFLNETPDLIPVLRDIGRAHNGLSVGSRQFVLGLIARMGSESPTAITSNGLAEQLTSRQLEILRLMADGRSNQEIADILFIALGTVKAHIHQITGKLMARNRTEAVATARRLYLLQE